MSIEAVGRAPIPADFPDELRPHARAVFALLRSTARAVRAKDPKPMALALTIMARPRKPLVRAAHDWAAWVVSQPPRRQPKDVIASYRNWLDRGEVDLAAIEQLPGEVPASMPENVTPLRRANSAEERRMERQQARAAMSRAAASIGGGTHTAPPALPAGR